MSNPSMPRAADLFSDAQNPREIVERREEFVKAMTESTVDGHYGDTFFAGQHETGAVTIAKRADRSREAMRAITDLQLEKSVDPSVLTALESALTGNREAMTKEWTLSAPIGTGLVPYDLEAPAKLLTPRPTPLRNSLPRVKAQGASRRFKVISGFTGTGTGIGTLQPGFGESTTNTGPGGLAFIRPPYISYAGYDVTLPYVSWGLSDSVSWQAEFQGQGFQDIRSLSNTALLYATMLMEERLMLYGRGSQSGYAGALGTPSSVTASAVAASVNPAGTSFASAASVYYLVAADAGDLLGTTGAYHQGPATTLGSASVVVASGQAAQITIGTDVPGALGYNLFAASTAAGPFFYAGRTGSNVGYISSFSSSGASIASGAADTSTSSTNFDGLLTNTAASGGYVSRLNSTWSTTTPGTELQACFSSLFDSVKADPDEAWFNGHDRNQLANALLSGNSVNNYGVRIVEPTNSNGVTIGAIVQGIVNQITGKEVDFNVHPWLPQGNCLVRSRTLPVPDSNVTDTSVMAMVQDYAAIQWPTTQFTYDASTIEIGTMAHYAPGWNGIIQGIKTTATA